MVRCLVALNRGDLGRPPWFTLLTWVFRRDFIKRDHLGFGFGCISRRERGQRLSLPPTPRHVRISSRCHSELRESRFLISCLLNHRLPDRAAKITSLFNEESLMVFFFFFFTLKTSISGSLLLPHFSETVVVTVTRYCVWCRGQSWANLVLLNSRRLSANPGF